MIDPRRVPWAFKSEIEELYGLLYAPGAGSDSLSRALSRISVYLSSASVPLFMPLLHGLVSAALLPYPPQSSEQALATRLSYSMALVRFVNGMVDPLQTGPFARPISHLAATLHIPPSLIALRHRATHEDLPPIETLHASIHLALGYLHASAFMPLLAPPEDTEGAIASSSTSGPSVVLVKRWKKVMKERIRLREVGNGGERGREVRNLKREFAELRSDAVEGLIAVGGLVPVARKKRPSAQDIHPPQAALQLWEPLLISLQSAESTFASQLAFRLTTVLLTRPAEYEVPMTPGVDAAAGLREHDKEVASYKHALVTWLAWIWEQDTATFGLAAAERHQIGVRLIKGLVGDDVSLKRLVKILRNQDEDFAERSHELLDILHAPSDVAIMDVDGVVESMEAHLAVMKQMLRPVTTAITPKFVDSTSAPGWTRASEDWRPTPIGLWGAVQIGV